VTKTIAKRGPASTYRLGKRLKVADLEVGDPRPPSLLARLASSCRRDERAASCRNNQEDRGYCQRQRELSSHLFCPFRASVGFQAQFPTIDHRRKNDEQYRRATGSGLAGGLVQTTGHNPNWHDVQNVMPGRLVVEHFFEHRLSSSRRPASAFWAGRVHSPWRGVTRRPSRTI
jgi:hypothetical protein